MKYETIFCIHTSTNYIINVLPSFQVKLSLIVVLKSFFTGNFFFFFDNKKHFFICFFLMHRRKISVKECV